MGLRSPPVVGPQGRDRVRRQGVPARRLLPHHRHAQPRKGRPARRAARVSRPAVPATAHRRARGGGHPLRHRVRLALRPDDRVRRAAPEPMGRGRRHSPRHRREPGTGCRPAPPRQGAVRRRAPSCPVGRSSGLHPASPGADRHPRGRARRSHAASGDDARETEPRR